MHSADWGSAPLQQKTLVRSNKWSVIKQHETQTAECLVGDASWRERRDPRKPRAHFHIRLRFSLSAFLQFTSRCIYGTRCVLAEAFCARRVGGDRTTKPLSRVNSLSTKPNMHRRRLFFTATPFSTTPYMRRRIRRVLYLATYPVATLDDGTFAIV